MAAPLDELKADLAELATLRAAATRPRAQKALDREQEAVRREMMAIEQKAAQAAAKAQVKKEPTQSIYQENITNYAWDQSDKFMKLYLTLDNLSAISTDDITSNFTDRSMTVKVKLPTKVCQLHIARLCEDILPQDCYCKKKSDYVLVMLKKQEAGKTWPWVTEREKKAKEKDKPKLDENEDPSAGLTKLLKNMYDEGDDEMKRTIGKAWSESQAKQAGGMPAF